MTWNIFALNCQAVLYILMVWGWEGKLLGNILAGLYTDALGRLVIFFLNNQKDQNVEFSPSLNLLPGPNSHLSRYCNLLGIKALQWKQFRVTVKEELDLEGKVKKTDCFCLTPALTLSQKK